ncbi:MAG: response regulator transcription factor [Deltaproteobacteria bacterium]|nr:response regulator transcription factor [Deltaproteobacteria bacterium]
MQKRLEDAKALFYSWRLVEAYNILRRYFDRLPFSQEAEHAQYIGMFVRVLAELGKKHELTFYMNELEKLCKSNHSPNLEFQLAVVYYYSNRNEEARAIFEDLIRNPVAAEFKVKSKMLLADYYQNKGDISACRQLIFSIDKQEDPSLNLLVEIWKAIVLRDESKLDEAEKIIEGLLGQIDARRDWYSYFSAKCVLANLFIKKGDITAASRLIREIRVLFEGRHFKAVQTQLEHMEKFIQEKQCQSVIFYEYRKNRCIIYCADKRLEFLSGTPTEKLLLLLAKNKIIDKDDIVRSLYSRPYVPERDDKLIYYHIHSLRKQLQIIGVLPSALHSERDGYRLEPKVEMVGGANENNA